MPKQAWHFFMPLVCYVFLSIVEPLALEYLIYGPANKSNALLNQPWLLTRFAQQPKNNLLTWIKLR